MIIFCFSILLNYPAISGENIVSAKNQGLYFENISIPELEELYIKNNSNYFIPRDNWEVPAIFLSQFPQDFYTIQNENRRNEIFIQILAPLALKLNQEILQERAKLEKIETIVQKGQTLTNKQQNWLEKTSEKYDVFTRLKGTKRTNLQISKLKEKIDIIPPSIMIAIAAIETNWGQSRFVKEGNALYREVLWNNRSGMRPQDEEQDQSYSIKKFPTLYDAMKSFALKINSGINYREMRTLRAQQRRRRKIIDGRELASSFALYSPQKNFIGMLDYTVTFYELINIDASKLVYELPLKKPARQEIVIKT